VRSVDEWVGRTDDSRVPASVKRRLIRSQLGVCACCCLEFTDKRKPEVHHVESLESGGPNRESNLELWCSLCHGTETKRQTKVRAKVNRILDRRYGFKTPKKPWGIPGLKKKVSGKVVPR